MRGKIIEMFEEYTHQLDITERELFYEIILTIIN